MFKVGQKVCIVGDKYPPQKEDFEYPRDRVGHGLDIGTEGFIDDIDENDDQPYLLSTSEFPYYVWVAASDIEEVK